MIWYLAGNWSRQKEFQGYRAKIRKLGDDVVAHWIDRGPDRPDEVHDDNVADQRRQWAAEDLNDITKSEGVISFIPTEDAHRNRNRGGRHVEFGLGLALNKRMVVIGPRENVFHWLPGVEQYDTFDEFLKVLKAEIKEANKNA